MSRDAPQWMLLIHSYRKGTEPWLLSLAFRVVVLYVLPLLFCPSQGCLIGAVGFLLVLDSVNLGALGRVGVWGLFWVGFFFPLSFGEILDCSCPHGWIGGSGDFRHLDESMSVLQNPRGPGTELQLCSHLVYGGPS